MATKIARHLDVEITMGAADAFIEGVIPTGIIPANGMAFQLLKLELLFQTTLSGISADGYVIWALTRDTKAAMAYYDDDDVILADGFDNALTTSGQVILPRRHVYDFPEGVYIVEPNLYVQNLSGATGSAIHTHWRLWYEEVKLTEVEILRLLNNA